MIYALSLPEPRPTSESPEAPDQSPLTQQLRIDLAQLETQALELHRTTLSEKASQDTLSGWIGQYIQSQGIGQAASPSKSLQREPQSESHSGKIIAESILESSAQHQFDPLFLLAVIQNESGFNSRAVGKAGEIGLMQITPKTARWICKKAKIRWAGRKALFDPQFNIQVGTAYLAYLREQFRAETRLYLSAYNMGTTHLRQALHRHIVPKSYSSRVFFHYKNISQAAAQSKLSV